MKSKTKQVKEKKEKHILEFPVRSSILILYNFISTSAGLQEWFADFVQVKGKEFSFFWKGMNPEKAELVHEIDLEIVRFHWLNSAPEEYLEFEIYKTEISNETILRITFFCINSDFEDQKQIWEYQVKELLHRLGN